MYYEELKNTIKKARKRTIDKFPSCSCGISLDIHNSFIYIITADQQGRNLVIMKGGRRYIYNIKDQMIYSLSQV